MHLLLILYLNLYYYSLFYISIMEWLISIFLITFPFILSLHISLKFSIESSKGIYSLFLNSFPYWTTYIICNDFLTLNQLNRFSRCINLGDLIALLGSIDFVLGSIDLLFMLRLFLLCIFNVVYFIGFLTYFIYRGRN